MKEEVISFYKDLGFMDDEMYNYLINNVEFVREDDTLGMSFVGCYTATRLSDGKLEKIKVFLPYGDDLKTTCIQVHEIGHFIDAYSYLEKPYEDYCGREIFPIAMERIFFEKTDLLDWFNSYQKELIGKTMNFNTTDYAFADVRYEHMLGFLHHFEYVDFYHETGTLPQIVDFKVFDNIDIKNELSKKAKVLLK